MIKRMLCRYRAKHVQGESDISQFSYSFGSIVNEFLLQTDSCVPHQHPRQRRLHKKSFAADTPSSFKRDSDQTADT